MYLDTDDFYDSCAQPITLSPFNSCQQQWERSKWRFHHRTAQNLSFPVPFWLRQLTLHGSALVFSVMLSRPDRVCLLAAVPLFFSNVLKWSFAVMTTWPSVAVAVPNHTPSLHCTLCIIWSCFSDGCSNSMLCGGKISPPFALVTRVGRVAKTSVVYTSTHVKLS